MAKPSPQSNLSGPSEAVAEFASSLRQGKPTTVHNLTVVPLFGPTCSVPLLPLAHGLRDGFVTVSEVDEAGDVNCLRVDNTGDIAVLIFDGEELVGAKQNRIVNTSILVPGGQRLDIPVSCVEQGRWRYQSREFATGTVLKTDMRRSKARRITENVRATGRYDADQGAVWDEVATYAQRRGTHSPTNALADVLEADRASIEHYVKATPLYDGQTGLAGFIDGELAGVDVLGTPEAYAALHARLLAAIAAEAIDRPAKPKRKRRASLSTALRQVTSGSVAQSKPPGLGTDVRLAADTYTATALLEQGQVIHLAVFQQAEVVGTNYR